MSVRVRFISDSIYGDYKKREKGFVDGYCRGGYDVPYAVVIKDDGKFVMAELSQIEEDKL